MDAEGQAPVVDLLSDEGSSSPQELAPPGSRSPGSSSSPGRLIITAPQTPATSESTTGPIVRRVTGARRVPTEGMHRAGQDQDLGEEAADRRRLAYVRMQLRHIAATVRALEDTVENIMERQERRLHFNTRRRSI